MKNFQPVLKTIMFCKKLERERFKNVRGQRAGGAKKFLVAKITALYNKLLKAILIGILKAILKEY